MSRLVLIPLLSSCPLLAADAAMTATERADALKWLDESRTEFLAAITGLSEQQWKWKPAPDRWSVGEVAEHIVLAEAGQFANVHKVLSSTPDPDWETKTKGKTERLVAVLAPRLGRVKVAEEIVPKGGMSQAEAKERARGLKPAFNPTGGRSRRHGYTPTPPGAFFSMAGISRLELPTFGTPFRRFCRCHSRQIFDRAR
jgi:hypothetical protein